MEIGIVRFVLGTLCRLFFNELYVAGIAECCAYDMLFQPHKPSFSLHFDPKNNGRLSV